MGKSYTKITPNFWHDEKFRSLSNDEKVLIIYLYTNANTGWTGAFHLALRQALLDLNIQESELSGLMDSLEEKEFIVWDSIDKIVIILDYFLTNSPLGNPNLVTHCVNVLDDISSVSTEKMKKATRYVIDKYL